jgi:hypothetical protein
MSRIDAETVEEVSASLERTASSTIRPLCVSIKSSCKKVYEKFTEHPHENGISYRAHLWKAARIAYKLGINSAKLWIHAVFPFLFKEGEHHILQEFYEQEKKKED